MSPETETQLGLAAAYVGLLVAGGLVPFEQRGDVSRDPFRGRGAEQLRAGGIRVLDASFGVDRRDRIRRAVENHAEEFEATLSCVVSAGSAPLAGRLARLPDRSIAGTRRTNFHGGLSRQSSNCDAVKAQGPCERVP